MTESRFPLAPAQERFLQQHVSDYDAHTWLASLAGEAGSDRRFVRVAAPDSSRSYVLVLWDSHDPDWERFAAIVDELGGQCEALPKVYARDEAHGLVLEEDFGTDTLHRVCENAPRETVVAQYRRVVQTLVAWQALDPARSPAISSRALDEEVFLWESDYFARHCVTEFFGCERFLGAEWQRQRTALAALAGGLPQVCCHRDFQSENIMVRAAAIGLVDFQGARLGPAGYDLASLIFDPYAVYLDPGLVAELYACYARLSPHADPHALALCATQRLMQALGAYGNLSIHKGKEWYRRYVPAALERLLRVLDECAEFPVIRGVVAACAERL